MAMRMMKTLSGLLVLLMAALAPLCASAHGSHQQHRQDFYDVFQFMPDSRLDAWMKYVSSDMIDGYRGVPRDVYGGMCFYDYMKAEFPGFACRHRLLFHWGYNSRPWSDALEARIAKCQWYGDEVQVIRFRDLVAGEQKMRNAAANALTEKTFGFASGGKDASFANAMISVLYDTHIIGDYTPDNRDLDGVMDFGSAVGDLINAIRKLDARAGDALVKSLQKLGSDSSVGVQDRAAAVLALLKSDFSPFLQKAQGGSLARRFAAEGYSFREMPDDGIAISGRQGDGQLIVQGNNKDYNNMKGDGFVILQDETRDGVRHITATPDAAVCSKQIDIYIRDGIIQDVIYLRGCQGNLKGLGALLRGMTPEEAVRRLKGIDCNSRGTSCPDQLARVLAGVFGL